jgi:neutral amino acid transport system permease protein
VPLRLFRHTRASALLAGAILATVVALSAPAGAQTDGEAEETPATEQAFRGTLRDGDREPVEGVTINVATEDGQEVGTAVTDASGVWSVPVPEPGRYSVSIDVDTLPEGAALQNPDRATLTPTVRPGQHQTVVFAIGERAALTTSRLDRLSNLAAEGVKFGLMIALAALGLSMVYGVTGLVNFAHGELLAFGAIMAYWLERGYGPIPSDAAARRGGRWRSSSPPGSPSLWEVGIFGPVRRRRSGDIAAMVISIGLALVVRYLYLTYGQPTRHLPRLPASSRLFSIGPVSLTPKSWITIVGHRAAGGGVGTSNTRIGTAMRAVSVNKDLAESSGIDVKRVVIVTWIVGGALAGLSGVLFGIAESVRWNMGRRRPAHDLRRRGPRWPRHRLRRHAREVWWSAWSPSCPPTGSQRAQADVRTLVLVVILLVRPQGILGVRERFG